ncbi:MAG: gmr [Symbiobacteriaceae bacterium]|jgi:diguanylate cyclase (GGDEF)-like protein/PAS domain S-box-containing protein|nr:gmr [Symbiobacteriaceae bacterium]
MQQSLQATHRLRQSIARAAAALAATGADLPGRQEIEGLLAAAQQASALMDSMAQSDQDLSITCDPNGEVTSISAGCLATLGYEPMELAEGEYRRLVHPDDYATLRESLYNALSGTASTNVEGRFRHKDGTFVWLEWTITPLADGAGAYGIGRDITMYKQYERLLRESEQLYRALFEYSPDGVFTLDFEGNVITMNPACTQISGYQPHELIGQSLEQLLMPEHQAHAVAILHTVMQGEAQNFESAIHHRDGRVLYLHATLVPLVLEGTVVGVYGVVRDITERKHAEERLAHMAFHDPLTGLANRTLFIGRLDQLVTENVSNQPSFAILYLDLDDFKIVNDSLGHRTGDLLLVEAARRLKSCVSAGDTVARLGGDEFTVILEGTQDTDDAIAATHRILRELTRPYDIDGHKMVVTPSVGVVMGNQGDDAKELLRYADIAMYKAKQNGKARYEAFTPVMYNHVLQRLQLETDLRRAIEHREFRVLYQPIVELGTGEIVGVEALIRWEDPEHGVISPAQFIPLAEETGLILPIGRFVLEEACRQGRKWQETHPNLMVSVNLSARQFREPFLAEEIVQVLQETDMPPTLLQLEITESILMQESATTQETLRHLKALGIQLAMDDFGTGYSSLSYLKRFPIDVLKIDRSFVDGLGENPEDTALVRTVIQLAKALNLTVTGEGVETAEQIAQLRAMECERGQGYFFARPLTPKAIDELLVNGRNW